MIKKAEIRWMEGWWNTRAVTPTSVEPTSYVRPRTRDHHRNPFHSPNWTWRTCCCVLLGICYFLAFQCVDGYLLLSKTVVLVGKWQTACAWTVGTCVKAQRGVLQTQKRQKLSVHWKSLGFYLSFWWFLWPNSSNARKLKLVRYRDIPSSVLMFLYSWE